MFQVQSNYGRTTKKFEETDELDKQQTSSFLELLSVKTTHQTWLLANFKWRKNTGTTNPLTRSTPRKKEKEKKLLQSIAQGGKCTIIKDLIKFKTIQNANQISARNRKTNLNKYGIFLEVRTTLLIFFSNNIQLWKVLKISKTDLSNSIQIYIFLWLWYWNTSNCSLVCGGCRGGVVIVDSSYIEVVMVDDSCDNGGHGYDCEWC